jgi:hypothetical protein
VIDGPGFLHDLSSFVANHMQDLTSLMAFTAHDRTFLLLQMTALAICVKGFRQIRGVA